MGTLGFVGGVTSKRDSSKCSWHAVAAAASCCQSLPKQPSSSHSRSLSWTRARGLRGEGEGKVGSDHSAAISLKKQLVRRTEAAAGCDTWIRTSLVIDCTAVLSLSLYSLFLLQIRLIFTLHSCEMNAGMHRRERSLCVRNAISERNYQQWQIDFLVITNWFEKEVQKQMHMNAVFVL